MRAGVVFVDNDTSVAVARTFLAFSQTEVLDVMKSENTNI